MSTATLERQWVTTKRLNIDFGDGDERWVEPHTVLDDSLVTVAMKQIGWVTPLPAGEVAEEVKRRGLLDSGETEGGGSDAVALSAQPSDAASSGGDGDGAAAAEAESTASPSLKHLGFGLYELSDGSRVKGKAEAQAAQNALEAA